VKASTEGFKGAMATFDATRPLVAASALGIVARRSTSRARRSSAAGVTIRYGAAASTLTAIERDFMDIESDLQAARLLTWRAAWMMDRGKRNNLEASMAKARRGLAVTRVDAEGGRVPRTARLLAQAAAREVDARCEDQRHLSRARSRSTCWSSPVASSATRAKS